MSGISIHDDNILVDSAKYVSSSGIGFQITLQDAAAPFGAISLNHVSLPKAQNSAFMFGAFKAEGPLSITNSLFATGLYGSTTTGTGPTDCSYQLNKNATQALTNCWSSFILMNNALLGSAGAWPSSGFQTGPAPAAGSGVDQNVLDGILKGVQ